MNDTTTIGTAGAALAHADEQIARVEALDPAEARRIFVHFDPERIRAIARAVDARDGDLPLRGVTVSIKDLFDETGVTTSAASAFLADRDPASADAPVIARLLAAGAVPFGRTNMSEFAYSGLGMNPHHGTPGNAIDPARVPGGSTSGGGVAAARGLGDVALGSDTGGSIRIPAALNGIAGFKPTQRAVPLDAAFPLSKSCDSIGPLAPRVALCAAVHGVLAGEARPARRHATLSGVRIGVAGPMLCEDLDAQVGADYEAALSALSAAGAQLREVSVPILAEAAPYIRVIVSWDAREVHQAYLHRLDGVSDPNVLRRIRFSETVSDDEHAAAHRIRAAAIDDFARIAADVDVLVSPTVPVVAPAIADAQTGFDRLNGLMLRNTSTVNFLDGCSASVPMNAPGALGTGLMLFAPGGADWRVLDIAEAVEAAIARR